MYLYPHLTWHLFWSALSVFLAVAIISKTFLPLGKTLLVSAVKTVIPFMYFAFFFRSDWVQLDDQGYLEMGHQLLVSGFHPILDIFAPDLWMRIQNLADSSHTFFYWWNALGVSLFGYHYWAPVFLNIAVTALTGWAIYGILRHLGLRRRHSQNVAILASLHWELLVWTSFLDLKDPLVALFAALTLLGILRAFYPVDRENVSLIHAQERITGIALAVASMAIVYYIRSYAPLFAVVSVAVWLIVRGRVRYVMGSLVVAWIALAIFNPFASERLSYFSLANPIYGLVHFILTPVPWRVTPGYSFLMIPAIINWATLPLAIYGMIQIWRTSTPARLLIIYCAVVVAVYSFVPMLQGPRQRVQILPFIAIFVYAGFRSVFRGVLQSRKRAHVQAISRTYSSP